MFWRGFPFLFVRKENLVVDKTYAFASREAGETACWLRLLHDNEQLPTLLFASIYQDIGHLFWRWVPEAAQALNQVAVFVGRVWAAPAAVPERQAAGRGACLEKKS